MFVHVVPIIHVSTSGEMKTKALQHSVIKLREM
jgi:CTP synthase (UTP-ammonia lyase)